jgi:hypothetical protein
MPSSYASEAREHLREFIGAGQLNAQLMDLRAIRQGNPASAITNVSRGSAGAAVDYTFSRQILDTTR